MLVHLAAHSPSRGGHRVAVSVDGTGGVQAASRPHLLRAEALAPPAKEGPLDLVDTGDALPTEASPAFLVLRLSGQCAQFDRDAAFQVKVATCADRQAQKWYFDADRLRLELNHKCLDHDTGQGRVSLLDCHKGSNQKWSLEDGKILSLSTIKGGMCLQDDLNDYYLGAVILQPCRSVGNQKWSFKRTRVTTQSPTIQNDSKVTSGPTTTTTLTLGGMRDILKAIVKIEKETRQSLSVEQNKDIMAKEVFR